MSTLAAMALSFVAAAGCELDGAQVAFIPPATARVLQVEQCGGSTCWSRYLVVDGQRRAESRVCEVDWAGRPLHVPAAPQRESIP